MRNCNKKEPKTFDCQDSFVQFHHAATLGTSQAARSLAIPKLVMPVKLPLPSNKHLMGLYRPPTVHHRQVSENRTNAVTVTPLQKKLL